MGNRMSESATSSKRRHFGPEIIVLYVRWYRRYNLSFCEFVGIALLAEFAMEALVFLHLSHLAVNLRIVRASFATPLPNARSASGRSWTYLNSPLPTQKVNFGLTGMFAMGRKQSLEEGGEGHNR
jgi:hypothetical protein